MNDIEKQLYEALRIADWSNRYAEVITKSLAKTGT